MFQCDCYCGVSCVDGSCPIALADIYQEYGMDVVRSCDGCIFYRGCDDCAFAGSDLCPVPLTRNSETR